MPADRQQYGDQQAALLRALLHNENPPEGFSVDDAGAASVSLIRKRARAAAKAWPALADALGERFLHMFQEFATSTPPPPDGSGLADGLAFAHTIPRMNLTDDARVELFMVRNTTVKRRGQLVPRRALIIRALRLRCPPRLLIVFRAPYLGTRQLVIPNRDK